MPPRSAPKKSGGNWAGFVGGVAVGVLFLGGLVFLFWTPSESKSKDEEKEKTSGKEKEKGGEKEKGEEKEKGKTPPKPFFEDFSDAIARGDALPQGWHGRDVAVMTDQMKRACLEPTLARAGVAVAILPPMSLKGDFTIEGDAYVYPSLSFVMEGEGPRLSVNVDYSGATKINDYAVRRPAKMGRQYAFMYKIIRKGTTVRVFLNDDMANSSPPLEKTTTVSKIQIGLGFNPGIHTRLYSIKVTRD
jgi:hypothetical protein